MTILTLAKPMAFIVTRNRERSKAFYGGTLGFTLSHEDGFAVVYDLNGTMLRISTVADHVAQQHAVLGWEVADIGKAAKALRERGVSFKIYDGFGQDDLGIWNSPGGNAKVAWFNDPDGNNLSLTQF